MSNPIQGMPASPDYGVTSSLSHGQGENGGEFVKTLQEAMSQVSQLQNEADAHVGELLTGNSQDVHSAMIAVEKASLAFEMMVQVRNKIVQAYQQVSGMQF
ncbi:MAG TPA: flagellar hook-basal body complex protein FliE [Candidatus Sulfotelmatobacter sp.]|nr:flagellar hook-basal body complex protein FliE [Candidatus Sulfotelmatobacter sp.]